MGYGSSKSVNAAQISLSRLSIFLKLFQTVQTFERFANRIFAVYNRSMNKSARINGHRNGVSGFSCEVTIPWNENRRHDPESVLAGSWLTDTYGYVPALYLPAPRCCCNPCQRTAHRAGPGSDSVAHYELLERLCFRDQCVSRRLWLELHAESSGR